MNKIESKEITLDKDKEVKRKMEMFFTPYGVLVGENVGEDKDYYHIKDILAFVVNPQTKKSGFAPLVPEWKAETIYQLPKGAYVKLKEIPEAYGKLWAQTWIAIRAVKSDIVIPTKQGGSGTIITPQRK